MSDLGWLTDDRIQRLAGDDALVGVDRDETRALASEVQERRAADREADEKLHAVREEAAGRPISKLDFLPAEAFTINPEPEQGASVPTEGLEVFFDEQGRCGLMPVAFPDSRFVLGAAAARQLAELIRAQQLLLAKDDDA